MLTAEPIPIAEIYVPTALRKSFDQAKLDARTAMLMNGEKFQPIQARRGKGRYVLIKGVHRLEAMRALGETEIEAFIVAARLR